MELDAETAIRLTILEEKIGEIHVYTKRLYSIMLWTGIITVAAIVLPIIGILFALPSFFSAYSGVGAATGDTSTQTPSATSLSGLEKTYKDLLK